MKLRIECKPERFTLYFLLKRKLPFYTYLLIFIRFFSRMISVVQGGKNMSEITRVALDAMGGDNAPGEIV